MENFKELQLIQHHKIGELLQELYHTNRYYRGLIEDYNVDLSAFSELEFLKLPYLTKDLIRDNEQNYLSRTSEQTFLELTTGTTGKPLRCYKTRSERLISTISVWQERRRWDSDVNVMNFVSLQGDKLGDPYNFNIENMKRVYDKILALHPRWISGSVTGIMQYARQIEKKILPALDSIRFIELTGEFVEMAEREYLEEVFGAKTIIHYGLRETWGIAYECSHNQLHVRDDLFHISGHPIKIGREMFDEIIVTSLYQKLMPIIKYKTGDLGYIKNIQCECGRYGTVLKLVSGRKAGIIKGPNEYLGDLFFKRVSNEMLEQGYDCIESFSVTQVDIDEFDIFIVKKANFNEDSANIFKDIINKRIGRKVKNNLIFVEEIPVLPGGKTQLFKCNL